MPRSAQNDASMLDEVKGKFGVIKKIIPVCLTRGGIKTCISDGLCGGPNPSQDRKKPVKCVASQESSSSMEVGFDTTSMEVRRAYVDERAGSDAEPVVALSVHGWARGHERKVVDLIKRNLLSACVKIHEIVSPADILLMFHDMTMGLNVENLLGRMRHAAAYSGAKQVLLVLVNGNNSTSTKGVPSTTPDAKKGKCGWKMSDRSTTILESAASLVVDYSYDGSSGGAPCDARNAQNVQRITDYIKAWVRGRSCIGLSIDPSHGGIHTPRINALVPAQVPSLGDRLMGRAGGLKTTVSLASISAARYPQHHAPADIRGSGKLESRPPIAPTHKREQLHAHYSGSTENPGKCETRQKTETSHSSLPDAAYHDPTMLHTCNCARPPHWSISDSDAPRKDVKGGKKMPIHVAALGVDATNSGEKVYLNSEDDDGDSEISGESFAVDLTCEDMSFDMLADTLRKDRDTTDTTQAHIVQDPSKLDAPNHPEVIDGGDAFEISMT